MKKNIIVGENGPYEFFGERLVSVDAGGWIRFPAWKVEVYKKSDGKFVILKEKINKNECFPVIYEVETPKKVVDSLLNVDDGFDCSIVKEAIKELREHDLFKKMITENIEEINKQLKEYWGVTLV